MKYIRIALVTLFVAPALGLQPAFVGAGIADDKLRLPEEKHLRNIRQLTFGGENAEAYFSFDGKKLILQSTREGHDCDQIYTMNIDGSDVRMVSTGKGRTTCSYFFRDPKRILYSSTHLASNDCPPKPDFSKGYVWALYPGYDIFTAASDGSGPRQLTKEQGYDAEATISPDGKKIVFTSVRDGDLDIYTMDIDGGNVKRLTTEVGYDGGPFFSYDGKWIVYRAHHPETDKEIADYKALLKENLIRPTKLDIWVMKSDGTGKRRVTNNGKANFAPFFFPDGKRIIFSSNMDDPRGRNFDLYVINVDGTGLERITYNETFDGFPMFTPDGKKIVFASNRNAKSQGETNVFIADWAP
jgi:Tol biopolymer transport system component